MFLLTGGVAIVERIKEGWGEEENWLSWGPPWSTIPLSLNSRRNIFDHVSILISCHISNHPIAALGNDISMDERSLRQMPA